MARNSMMDMMMYRGRMPYMGMDYARGGRGRRGRRGSRRDMARGDYNYDNDYTNRYSSREYDNRGGSNSYTQYDSERGGRDYERGNQSDMGTRYPFMVEGEFGRYDGHYPYYEPMMYDYARGGRGGRGDRGYDDYGDYGEGLTKEELHHWKMKLMKEVDEKDKSFFEISNIMPKAKQMGAEMKDYSEEELCLVTLMAYTDYCDTIKKYVGNNMDIYVGLAKDWLEDKDSELKGSERLAVYHDCIIEGEDD